MRLTDAEVGRVLGHCPNAIDAGRAHDFTATSASLFAKGDEDRFIYCRHCGEGRYVARPPREDPA